MQSRGKIKFASAGLGWKEALTGLVTTVKAEDIQEAQWVRAMRGYRLRLKVPGVPSGWLEFDGFCDEAHVKSKNGIVRFLYSFCLFAHLFFSCYLGRDSWLLERPLPPIVW